MTVVEVQHVVETQTITTYVNVVDVNVTTRNKVIEEYALNDREPNKAKGATVRRKKNG
jgi:hypothetical protein